ncbi:MAG: hypothetical protein HRT72_12295 [Flavobacteriales bacterium]|nr:hypothetical protein [Flavobacteriales bacterium]
MTDKDITIENLSALIRVEALQKSNQMANAKILSILRRTEFNDELKLLTDSTDILFEQLSTGLKNRLKRS